MTWMFYAVFCFNELDSLGEWLMAELTNESRRQIDASRLVHPALGHTNSIGSSKNFDYAIYPN